MGPMTPFQERIRSIQVMGVRTDSLGRFARDVNREGERELERYRDLREKEGLQPGGTRTHQLEYAMRESDRLGKAYRADALFETYRPKDFPDPVQWSHSPYVKDSDGNPEPFRGAAPPTVDLSED